MSEKLEDIIRQAIESEFLIRTTNLSGDMTLGGKMRMPEERKRSMVRKTHSNYNCYLSKIAR